MTTRTIHLTRGEESLTLYRKDWLSRLFLISCLAIFMCPLLGKAQVPYRVIAPDIRYYVGGQMKPSRLSNDDVLFTILAFEGEDAPGKELPFWYTDETIKPYFQNYNPDYGRTLMVISRMKNQKGVERKLGVSSYPEYILVGPDRRILTRSSKAEDIIAYVTTHLSEYAETDWEAYLLRAGQLFESGQSFAARRIVSDCLRRARWDENFSPEVHKIIPRIVATMKGDDMYMDFVGEIKHRFNQGILSEEDVAPFTNEFSRIHIMSDSGSLK